MTGLVLLRVQTASVTFELRGPVAHRLGLLGAERAPRSHLRVNGLLPGDAIISQKADGTWMDLEGDVPFPRFFEDTQYRLSVLTNTGTLPSIEVRDIGLLSEVDSYPGQGLRAGPINFGRQVGLSDFVIKVQGRTITITIEVVPTKLDYQTDFREILHEIAGAGRALGLEYLRSTYIAGSTQALDERNSALEWLVLVRREVKALERAFSYIEAHPHRTLTVTEAPVRVDRIRRADARTRQAAMRGSGTGPSELVPKLGILRREVAATIHAESLDTPEHRWLASAIRVVRDRLSEVHGGLVREIAAARRRGVSPARLLAEIAEVEELIQRVARLQSLDFVRSGAMVSRSEFTSLRLLTAPGYAEAYKALLALRLGLHIDGEALDLSLKDLSTLFEVWCFLRVARMICVHSDQLASTNAIGISERGIRINLVKGRASALVVEQGARRLTLSYNPTFPGLTGEQKPDIVLEIRDYGWPAMYIILDAKYRLRADEAYLRQFGIPGPPSDAINALHRYRDAIVLAESGAGLGRPVVMGAALYPLAECASQHWPASRLRRALDELGIGAIPFLPGNTAHVETWLSMLLSQSSAELSRPGPPFLAWESLRGMDQ